MSRTKITVVRRDPPNKATINSLLQWYGASLGLFSLRDKNSSCFRVFITLLRNVRSGEAGMRSDDIADRTDLSRGTVVHHLNNLREKNIIVREESRYFLKMDNLQQLTNDIRRDLNEVLDDVENVGTQLDSKLDL